MFRSFVKNYTRGVFQFFVIFFTSKKSVFNAKNENSENAENAENPHQKFDCYGVIQQLQEPYVGDDQDAESQFQRSDLNQRQYSRNIGDDFYQPPEKQDNSGQLSVV